MLQDKAKAAVEARAELGNLLQGLAGMLTQLGVLLNASTVEMDELIIRQRNTMNEFTTLLAACTNALDTVLREEIEATGQYVCALEAELHRGRVN